MEPQDIGTGLSLAGPRRDLVRLPIRYNAYGPGLHAFDYANADSNANPRANPNLVSGGGVAGFATTGTGAAGTTAGSSTPSSASSPLLSLSAAQWAAMLQAFQSSLSNEKQITKGNITAPTLDVGQRLYGALLSTGQFTTAQAQQIYYDGIVPALGGGSHLNASSGSILTSLTTALGSYNPANAPAPPSSTDPSTASGTAGTDPTLQALTDALTAQPTTPQVPSPDLYAQPTDTSGGGASPSLALPLILLAGGGGLIFWWWKKHHGAKAGEEHHGG